MSQLNKIIEACEYASDAYWGNPERFKFRAFIDSFATQTELTMGQDRLVKGTFNIRLRGYIIPEVLQKDIASLKQYNSKSKVIIGIETTSNSDIFNPDVTKLSDGRTRKKRAVEGNAANVNDVAAGRELKS
jgi:hypothetical protein